VRGKEGVSLGVYSARALQVSRMRAACASQLYNYLLRFYLIIYYGGIYLQYVTDNYLRGN
jgi:hypothetical protein